MRPEPIQKTFTVGSLSCQIRSILNWLVPDSFSGNHQHSGRWGRKQAFGASSATDIHTNGLGKALSHSLTCCFLLCEESTHFQTRRLSLPSFALYNSVVCSQNLSVPHQPTSASSLHRWITRGSLVGSLSVSSFPQWSLYTRTKPIFLQCCTGRST